MVGWIKMFDEVIFPKYETKKSVGMDIRFFENHNQDYRLYAGQSAVFGTGLKVSLPKGFELQIRPRSGLAFKHGITVLNSPGTIDGDYEGEIKVLLINHGPLAITFEKGDRIAQAVFAPTYHLPGAGIGDNVRGEGGLGSTGVK